LTREAEKKIHEKRTGRSGIKIIKIVKIQSRSSEKDRGRKHERISNRIKG
jgi:hypothetical protein